MAGGRVRLLRGRLVGRVRLPEGVEALQFAVDLAEGGYIEKDLLTTIPAFEQTNTAKGKIACTWQQGPADVAGFWGEENVVVLPPLKEAEAVAFGTVGSLSVLKTADSLDAAGKWAAFATSPEVSAEYAKAAGWFSPYESESGLYADDAVLSALRGDAPVHDRGRGQREVP